MDSSLHLRVEGLTRGIPDADRSGLKDAVAQNLNRDDLTRLGFCDREHQLPRVKHLLAVEPRNHISNLEPGLLGRSVWRNTAHQHAGGIVKLEFCSELRRQVLSFDPEIAAATYPNFTRSVITLRASSEGTAKPMPRFPPELLRMAVLMPMRRPVTSTNAPPSRRG